MLGALALARCCCRSLAPGTRAFLFLVRHRFFFIPASLSSALPSLALYLLIPIVSLFLYHPPPPPLTSPTSSLQSPTTHRSSGWTLPQSACAVSTDRSLTLASHPCHTFSLSHHPVIMSSSSDEGEIRDDGAGHLKASHQHSRAGIGVDPRGRPADSSPTYDSASRASALSRQSPPPRGYKRVRDDGDHYHASSRDHDPRQPRARHDDRPRNGYSAHAPDRDSRPDNGYYDHRRPRISYEDLDTPSSRASNHHDHRRPPRNHSPNRNARDGRRSRGRRDRDRESPDAHDRYGYSRRRSRSPDRARRDDNSSAGRPGASRHDRNPNGKTHLPVRLGDQLQGFVKAKHAPLGETAMPQQRLANAQDQRGSDSTPHTQKHV